MPNALPIELRERAVRAYADGHESCEVVAERLSLNPWTLLRWIGRQRETGSVAPASCPFLASSVKRSSTPRSRGCEASWRSLDRKHWDRFGNPKAFASS